MTDTTGQSLQQVKRSTATVKQSRRAALILNGIHSPKMCCCPGKPDPAAPTDGAHLLVSLQLQLQVNQLGNIATRGASVTIEGR
jgi:hypothetical protein